MKILATLSLILLSGLLLLAASYAFLHRPLPVGREGQEAEMLADKMLKAVHADKWEKTNAVAWSFRDHHYLWDKKRKVVDVRWDSFKVIMFTNELSGIVYKNGKILKGKDADKAIDKAWGYFVNDSFWLAAPFKIRDPGTKRSVVETEEGMALLVIFSAGGITPGDSYLWFLANDGTPVAWKLWVKIIPVGGVRFSWDNWRVTETGARIATLHQGILDLEIKNLRTASSMEDLNEGKDPFHPFN